MIPLLHPKGHFLAFREIWQLLTSHRQLTWEMTKREISEKYAGQFFGSLWALCHPIVLMIIYVFIFCYVFRMKIGDNYQMPLDYTAYILSGLIPWLAFQEIMSKSVTAITGNSNLVKQIVFPLEVLPVKGVLASTLSQVISSIILIIYVLVKNQYLHVTYLLLPILLFFQILAMTGVALFLSSIGAYFKDLKDFVQVFCVGGMFLIPMFYLPNWVPEKLKIILYINPFSYMVWCYQDALYFGRFEHPFAWIVFISGSIGTFYIGYRVFRKLKNMFGNVL